jgi:hypothetical protein
MRRLTLVLLAAVEWFGAALFDVNGDAYDWWRGACIALAVVTLALAVLPAPVVPRAVALVGILPAVAAFVVATQLHRWENALAVVFFVGCAAATPAVAARSPRASA